MIEFKNWVSVPYDFTGICKVKDDESIRYYKDGRLHKKDGPAIESRFRKEWYINGLHHREDGAAIEYKDGTHKYYYKGEFIAWNDRRHINISKKSWKEKVKQLKREDELRIFI